MVAVKECSGRKGTPCKNFWSKRKNVRTLMILTKVQHCESVPKLLVRKCPLASANADRNPTSMHKNVVHDAFG